MVADGGTTTAARDGGVDVGLYVTLSPDREAVREQPTVILRLEGKSASLNSVKQEISQRIHRHFMIAGLRVDWDDDES